MRINAAHLPPGLDSDGFTDHIVLNGGLDGGFGDTLVGVHAGVLVVLTRGSSLDDYDPVALSRPPALSRGTFDSKLKLTDAAGAVHELAVLSLDIDDVVRILAAGAPAPEPAVDVAALEEAAVEAVGAGRYDLAGEAFERLARAASTETKAYVVLAECSQLLADGDAEGAFFKLRYEVEETVAPTWVLSRAAGVSLLASRNLPLASAAFASAAAAAGSGNDELAQRARAIRDEAGVDEVSLERAIVDATIEHYAERLDVDPSDNVARDIVARTQAARDRLDAMISAAAAPVTEAISELVQPLPSRRADPAVDPPAAESGGLVSGLIKGLLYAAIIVWLLGLFV